MSDIEERSEIIKDENSIAGFWRRTIAFLLDATVIAAIGYLLGWLFFDYFARLGGWGLVVGFAVALLYFGLLNSALTGGQTLGKRVMRIKCVARDGGSLSLGRSFLRFTVLGIPFFLNHAPLPDVLTTLWGRTLVDVGLYGLGLSILYLYVFNRRTRQSLHDLVVGSYVIETPSTQTELKLKPSRVHYVVVSIFLIGSALIPVLTTRLAIPETLLGLMPVREALEREPEVRSAGVGIESTRTITGKAESTTTSFNANIVLAVRVEDHGAVARKLAGVIFEKYPAALDKDLVVLNLRYGYDIGIASVWTKVTFRRTPQAWIKRLNLPEDNDTPSTIPETSD